MAHSENDNPTVTLTRPLRLEVLVRLTEYLQEITVANGYHFDLGDKVFRGMAFLDGEAPTDNLTLLEAPQQPDTTNSPGGNSEFSVAEWDILLKGECADPLQLAVGEHPCDRAHIMMADVKKRLVMLRREIQEARARYTGSGPNVLGLGPTIDSFDFSPGIVRPPDEQYGPLNYFWMRLTFRIVEDRLDPYKIAQGR